MPSPLCPKGCRSPTTTSSPPSHNPLAASPPSPAHPPTRPTYPHPSPALAPNPTLLATPAGCPAATPAGWLQWLVADLAAVDRCRTPWVVLSMHRPMYVVYPHKSNRVVGDHLRCVCRGVGCSGVQDEGGTGRSCEGAAEEGGRGAGECVSGGETASTRGPPRPPASPGQPRPFHHCPAAPHTHTCHPPPPPPPLPQGPAGGGAGAV